MSQTDYQTPTDAQHLDDWDAPPSTQATAIVRPGSDPLSGLASLAMVANQLGVRDERRIAAEAKNLGQRMGRAAFYSWSAAGSTVEGPAIQLAYALQNIWGRIQSKVIVTDERPDRIQMEAMVIDLLSVTCTSRPFTANLAPPPGKFANKADQVERWRTMQMQSAVSKAVRGAILATIPHWVTQTALNAAQEVASSEVLRGRTVAVAARDAVAAMAKADVTQADLEALVGRPLAQWAVQELEDIADWMRRLKRGETTVEALRAETAGSASAATQAAPWAAPAKAESRLAADAADGQPAKTAKPANAKVR